MGIYATSYIFGLSINEAYILWIFIYCTACYNACRCATLATITFNIYIISSTFIRFIIHYIYYICYIYCATLALHLI